MEKIARREWKKLKEEYSSRVVHNRVCFCVLLRQPNNYLTVVLKLAQEFERGAAEQSRDFKIVS